MIANDLCKTCTNVSDGHRCRRNLPQSRVGDPVLDCSAYEPVINVREVVKAARAIVSARRGQSGMMLISTHLVDKLEKALKS